MIALSQIQLTKVITMENMVNRQLKIAQKAVLQLLIQLITIMDSITSIQFIEDVKKTFLMDSILPSTIARSIGAVANQANHGVILI